MFCSWDRGWAAAVSADASRSAGKRTFSLEFISHTDLHDTSGPRLRDGAGVRFIEIQRRKAQVRMVCRIEGFPAQLRPAFLGDPEKAGKRQVDGRGSGAVDNIATRVA